MQRAFEALVHRYRRPLLNYCRRISASDASAEDALQQALLQAWVALSNGTTEVKDAQAWLYRIVHNVAVSNLRRPAFSPVPVDEAQGAGGADQEVERRIAVQDALATGRREETWPEPDARPPSWRRLPEAAPPASAGC